MWISGLQFAAPVGAPTLAAMAAMRSDTNALNSGVSPKVLTHTGECQRASWPEAGEGLACAVTKFGTLSPANSSGVGGRGATTLTSGNVEPAPVAGGGPGMASLTETILSRAASATV